MELANPIQLDDAVCLEAKDTGLLIEPNARPIRWLPIGLLGTLLAFSLVLWLMTFLSIHFSVLGLIWWLVRVVVWTVIVIGLVLALYPQWRSVQTPVFFINRETQLVEMVRANSIRRIPFSVIKGVAVKDNPGNHLVNHLENAFYKRLRLQRRGIGLVLKHGEVVWCGWASGHDAEMRANATGQRIIETMDA